ncbi:immunoglobulin domain-containing protein [Flavobacterium caseinilyticum]|uniref:T9SS type A sorting domain-containing protein n=1 Tax=Flavobacterium caseinilyticum TaxID=2541732 RepID=A0A4R5AQ44_9FLAO|nr:immunoglobulin domain-containing protein [Flavobacterium caseinilyticum]TDD75178.1 T9SS type A sorting domain-containing protein [Flavobacterium caseinilyticum]
MKKKYFIILLLFLSSLYSFGQDCAERNVSDDIICSGQSASIILTGSVNLQDYQLRVGTTIIATKTGTGADVTFSVNPSSTTTYNIIAVGCSSPYTDNSIVTVNPNLVPAVSIAANTGNSICAGTSVIFTAAPTNGGTTPSYQWFVGTTPVGSNSATYTTSALTNGNQVKVVMTSNATCALPTTATSNVFTMTVNTLVVPTVTLSATQTTFCVGTAVTFNINNLNNGGLNPTYQWRVNGNPVGVNSASFTSNALSNNDNVTVDVTSSATCPSPSMVTSNAIKVTVSPDASISLTSGVGSNNQTLCANSPLSPITFAISGGGTGAVVTGLPAGLTGSFSGGVVTISGTPTASGSFTYTVTTTGTCVQTTATGVIKVNPVAVISLTSGAGSNNQTKCINVALNTITFAVSGGGTGATVTGLPAGLIGTFSGGTFTISGTPTAIGSFPYIVTTTGTCTQTTATGTITINPDAVISVISGASTNNQTLCANTSLTNISYSISGGGTGATVSGLPSGVSGSFSASTFTIAGTPTVSGTFPYSVTTTGSCVQVTATGSITVSPDAVITLTSAAGTNNQTRCINTVISTITFAVSGGGTGANITGLPAGLTGVFNSGTFTISGTPTASGSFPYTITTTGTCAQKTATGTLIVTPNAAINLTSGAVTNDQTKCINVAITNITFAVSGGGTGATVTGLPAGVTGSFSGNIYTINGVPTASGSFPYTVTTTGACVQATATGTITVSPNAAITLTSGGGSNNLTRCINTAISTITFAISGGGTGATVTGLPTGVNGIYSGGTFTINGTPTVSGSFPYTVTTTGSCNQTTATGTITVNPAVVPSVTITSTSTSICNSAGTSVTFTATPVNGGTNPTYQWQRNGVNINSATNSTYTTTSLASPSTITVVMTSNIGCASPVTVTSNSIIMTVYTAPPSGWNGSASISISPSKSICPTANITLTAPAGATGVQYYNWILPSGWTILSGDLTNTITVSVTTAAQTGNQVVTVQAVNTCGNISVSTASNGSNAINVNSFTGVTVSSATQSVCSNSAISVVGTLTGNANAGTWSAPSGNFSNIITSGTNPIIVSATYTPAISAGNVILTIKTNTPTGCSTLAGTATVNVTVNQAVVITSQPIASQTACSGSNVSMSAEATGTGLTYQWKKGSTPLVNGGNISGATSATLNLTSVSVGDAGSYNVIVSGASSCTSVASLNAILNVNQVVAISAHPAVSQTLCSGNSASFNVTATGTGLNYQWRKGTTNLVNAGSISGATTATLVVNPVSPGDAAADYNVVITGSAPCTPLTSNNAALVVNQVVAITAQPLTTQTLCSGSTATFSVSATGSGLTYQWRKGTTNLSNTGNITGVTTATLNLSNLATSDAGSYNVIVSGASPCGPVASSTAALIVNQIVDIGTQPATSQTVCSGTAASFNVVATGTGLTYQWRKGSTNLTDGGAILGATTATLTINPAVSGDASSDYNVIITGTAPCTPLTSNNAALVVNQVVAITAQPPTTQTLCSGSTATFSVSAAGTGLNYQWKKGGTDLVNGSNVSGATTSTLTLANVTSSDAANYTVVVSGTAPCTAVTSNISSLVVNQIVAVNTQPAPTQTVCSGTSASFNVVATGTGLTYQWRKGTTNLTNGGTISGATTATLTINPTVSGDAASDYNVVITGTVPCAPLTSNNATLVINQAVSIITQPPATQTLCSGGTATLNVNATGAGLIYQWRKGSTNLVNGANIAGANSSTLTLSNLQTTDTANDYNVVITGTGPCIPLTSNNSILIINRLVTINTQPSNVGVCASNPATFGVVASGDGLTFQWYKGIIGSGVAVVNSANITGANTNVLNFAQAALTDDGPYYAIVSGISPCAAITSDQVTLNIDQSIAITSQPISKTVCEDTANVSFSVTADAGGDPLTYQWRKNGGNITGETSATYTITTAALSDAGNYDVIISGSSGYTCTSIQSTAVLLTISPKPIGSATTQTICSGSSTNVALNSTVSGTTFSWIAAIQTNPTGGTITGFSDSSGNTIAQSLNNTGTSAGTIRYTITPTANFCTGITFTVDVTINPAPVGSAIAQTICSGSTTNVALNSAVTGTTYSWTAAIQTSPTEGTITGFSNGTQNTIVQTLNNTGTTAGIIRYTVTPTSNSCLGLPFTVDVTVNPNSTIVLSSGAGSDNPTNCVNTVLNISYAIGGGGTNASITAGALPAGVTGSYNSGTRVYTISGTPSVVGTFNYTVTTQGLCSNASLSGSITVNPAAQVNLPTNQVFCNGSSSTVPAFTTINTIGTTTYSWTNNTALIGLAATGTGNIPVFTAANTGTSPVVATIVVTPTFNNGSVNCAGSSKTFTITIDPNPKGGILSFGATGRIFLSCIDPNPNAAVVVVNPVKLDLTGIVGTIVKWEYRTSTAPSWSVIPDGAGNFTGTSLSASQINNLKITASTVFRVEISSGACSPNVYSETAIISVIPTNIKPSPVSANKKVICIGEGVELSSQTGYGESFGQFEGGAFDNSSITNKGWRITDQFGNTNFNFESSADNRNPDKWLRTNPHDFATANLTPTYEIVDKRWDTSLSTAGNKGFAIVSGNNPSTLETAVFSLGALDEAILTFDQAYNLTPGATIKVEISTNGGVSYTSEPILFQQSGIATSGNYDRFGQGTPGINQMEIDLGDYIGYSNLRVRFSYTGSRVGDIWALDNIKVPEGPRDVNLQWTDTTDPSNPIIIGTTNNVTWTPTKIGWNIFVVKTSLILDSAGNTCSSPVNQEEVRVFAFDKYTTTTVASAVGCGTNSVPLSAAVVGGKQGAITSYPTPDGYVGEWSIQGPVGFVLSNPDQSVNIDPKNNPKAIFTAANIGDYTINWVLVPMSKDENGQIIQNTTCIPNYIGPKLSIQDCTTLDFDGVDDYVDLGTGYTGTYSIEAWIRPYPRLKADGTFTDASKGTIISTKNLEINMSDLPSSVVLNKRWYHIAVDTDGKLYVDGINVNKTISAKGTDRAFIGARWTPPNTDNHFSGWIEEVRIWDGKITEDQIRFTMNQRLQNNANIGVEIPMPAPGFGFGTLKGYFQLLIGTITNGGYTPDNSTIPVNGKLRNMTTWQENTAPLPYTSANDGDWNVMSTWTQPVVWDYPNSVGIDVAKTRIDWNIVKISNNIKSVEAGGKDGITLLGLKSISGKLTMAEPAPAPQNESNSGRMLWITHYLKLDGNIDLVGESQLLQKRYGSYDSDFYFSTTQVNESILEEASLGYIERDQQGQRNSYNYNYWSSPVSIQGGANNAPYSVIGVAKDGTNSAAPGLISFNDGAYFADGALSSPIKTSNRWIWSYNDKVKSTELQNYNQWNYLGSTGFLKTGEGFTMKGTGGTAATNVTQNYVFIGKPNNATISLPLPLNQIYLVGNPYPSALDANEFIRNNLKDCAGCTATQNVFNGTLYFWDHFGVTNNHILAQYTGGYAAYNLSGGVPGIANSVLTVNNNSSGSRSPKRYIPVAQGFFIDAPLGTAVAAPLLNFNNNQRAFKRESPESSVFMKSVGNKKTQIIDARSKIRLGFDSFVGIHRQLLVTADSNTTSGPDIGYDAPTFDMQKNDIYWEINNKAYVIQGINNFNEDQVIPLGITIADKGPITIKIDELENITESTKIFLFDSVTARYQNIRDEAFSISLDIGEYKNRFYILFLNKTLGVEESFLDKEIDVLYARNYKTLIIQNKTPDTTVNDVYLINLLGQIVDKWDVEDKDQRRIQIPIKNFASGVYIVKLKTSEGEMSTKIIIK